MQIMASSFSRHRALAGLTRSRLLVVLRASDRPLAVREVAEAVGLHTNSVREQLDRLVEARLVARATADPAGRGRPGFRYVATPDEGDSSATAYRELAGVLAGQLARQPDPVAGATAAGERWGRAMVVEAAPLPAPTATETVQRLVTLLDDAGFAPERPAGPGEPIRLRQCPFGALVREHQVIICGIHLGLMRGALRQLDAPLDVIRLEPFVTPDLCVAHVGALQVRTDG
jgi:predicted ArsR family transcriptional regulator